MPGPAFDPNGSVRFDLKRGAASDVKGARLVLVPSSAVEAMEQSHPAAATQLGAELGRACGARVAGRLGGDSGVRNATLEVVVSHLAGELAVAGIGSVVIERWGRAMVIVVTNPSVSGDVFIGAVLAGAIRGATSRDVATASLGKHQGAMRFFVGSKNTADKVSDLVARGTSHGEVLASIQGGAA
jgi:hypothetical protein